MVAQWHDLPEVASCHSQCRFLPYPRAIQLALLAACWLRHAFNDMDGSTLAASARQWHKSAPDYLHFRLLQSGTTLLRLHAVQEDALRKTPRSTVYHRRLEHSLAAP